MKSLVFLFVSLFVLFFAQHSKADQIPIRELEVSIRIKKNSLETPRKGEETVCTFQGSVGLYDFRATPDAGTFRPTLKCLLIAGA
jgi:hypothetical protein